MIKVLLFFFVFTLTWEAQASHTPAKEEDSKDTKKDLAKVHIQNKNSSEVLEFNLTIHEGQYRQIHRMVEALDGKISFLSRINMAGFSLKGLKRGDFRILKKKELDSLYKQCRLN